MKYKPHTLATPPSFQKKIDLDRIEPNTFCLESHSHQKHFQIDEVPFHLSEQQFYFHVKHFLRTNYHFKYSLKLHIQHTILSVNRKLPNFLIFSNFRKFGNFFDILAQN